MWKAIGYPGRNELCVSAYRFRKGGGMYRYGYAAGRSDTDTGAGRGGKADAASGVGFCGKCSGSETVAERKAGSIPERCIDLENIAE